jgi:hypothetical protein
MAVILERVARLMGKSLERTGEGFADEAQISGYAAQSARVLQGAGLLSGDAEGRFNPHRAATRAETAKMICMLSE